MTLRRSALLTGPGRIEIVEEQLPPPGPSQVLVETHLGSVSVGTELAQYLGAEPRMRGARYPLMTGYENVATVVALGGDVAPAWLGRRVLASYGHHTAALLDVERLIAIPDNIPDELALLTILAADAGRAVEHAALDGSERCLILGAGALGLLTLLNLQRAGAERITVVDIDRGRLTLPAALGAETVEPDAVVERAVSAPVAFECSAAPRAFLLAQRLVSSGGRIVVVSDGNAGDLVLADEFHDKELTVVGSNSHPDLPAYAAAFLTEAVDGRFDAYGAIFDSAVALEELPALFERMAAGKRVRKPLVHCVSEPG